MSDGVAIKKLEWQRWQCVIFRARETKLTYENACIDEIQVKWFHNNLIIYRINYYVFQISISSIVINISFRICLVYTTRRPILGRDSGNKKQKIKVGNVFFIQLSL